MHKSKRPGAIYALFAAKEAAAGSQSLNLEFTNGAGHSNSTVQSAVSWLARQVSTARALSLGPRAVQRNGLQCNCKQRLLTKV